jgi:hypothetical protein
MEATDMKSLSILGSAIWLAFAALNTTALAAPKGSQQAAAESLGDQCRAAVRAELRGPDCRMSIPTAACNMSGQFDVPFFDGRVVACVKRGGPGRPSKT